MGFKNNADPAYSEHWRKAREEMQIQEYAPGFMKWKFTVNGKEIEAWEGDTIKVKRDKVQVIRYDEVKAEVKKE